MLDDLYPFRSAHLGASDFVLARGRGPRPTWMLGGSRYSLNQADTYQAFAGNGLPHAQGMLDSHFKVFSKGRVSIGRVKGIPGFFRMLMLARLR